MPLIATGDWALAFPAPGRLKIQAVLQGAIWLVTEGIEHPVRLETGDIAVFAPHGATGSPAVRG